MSGLRDRRVTIRGNPGAIQRRTQHCYEEATKNSFRQYEIYEESYFIIKKVEAGKLWFEDYMDSDMEIYSVFVSKKISSLAKEGWTAYLELGRKNKRWYITGSGKVYPD